MTDLPARWAPQHPDRIQLYSMATPNGQKVSVALEEMELPYEPHLVHIGKGDQHDPAFLRLNPNGKIPAIVDPAGPDGEPIALMESGAILTYLADKSGKLMPASAAGRYQTLSWVFFQVGHVGPMFGQFGHFFKFASDKTTDDYGVKRYTAEVTRLLGVLNERLADRPFLVGDEYTIADVATFPWVKGLDFYDGKDAVEYARFGNVEAWMQRCLSRPAVRRGLVVNRG